MAIRCKRSLDVVPTGFEVIADEVIPGGYFIGVVKGDPGYIEGEGYDAAVFKVFVQPAPEKREEIVGASLQLLDKEPNVESKFLSFDLQGWQIPEQEKLVIYMPSEESAKSIIRELCDRFGMDAYRYGSARDMTWGRYSTRYGARLTHQVNPMIHLRRAGRDLHKELLSRTRITTSSLKDIHHYSDAETAGLLKGEASLKNVLMKRETVRELINYSLNAAGVLQLELRRANGHTTTYTLDPRRQYSIGRDDLDICLASNKASRSHALILPCDEGYILLDNKSTNGTYLNGKKLGPQTPFLLAPGQEIRFGEDLAYTKIAQVQ